MTVLREFLRQSPPTFQGSPNPLDADRLIHRVKKVFDVIGVAEDLKFGLAMYLFDGEADHWWESVKRRKYIDAAIYLFDGEADHWWESVKRRKDIDALT